MGLKWPPNEQNILLSQIRIQNQMREGGGEGAGGYFYDIFLDFKATFDWKK